MASNYTDEELFALGARLDLVRGPDVIAESLEDKIQRVVRAELRRCGLKPPRPAAEMIDGRLRTWTWDDDADAWVPSA